VLYVWLEQLLARGDYRRKLVASGATRTPLPPPIDEQAETTDEIEATMPRLRQISSSPPRATSQNAVGQNAQLAAYIPHETPSATDATGVTGDIAGVATTEQRPPRTRLGVNAETTTVTASTNANVVRLPPWAMMLIAALVAWALIVSRRPDALFNAQFWAEDGVWFSQAYNLGSLPALLIPNVGYLSLIPRLTAALAMLFPLLYAPLIFNVVGIVFQSLPAVFLFSGRFDEIVPSLPLRVLLGFLYVALPNSFEVNATITNTQWHLAVLTCMIAIAAIPRSIAGKAFDISIILLSGLSGPFCVALAPILVLRWWIERREPREHGRYIIALFVANAITIGVQGWTYLSVTATTSRVHPSLGASPVELARILAGQVFVGAIVGVNEFTRIAYHSWWATNKLVVVIAAGGLLFFGLALWKGSNPLRLFILYAGLVFGLCLISPLTAGPTPAWVQLASPGAGVRYDYIPMVAFVVVLVWLLSRRRPAVLPMAGALALMVMLLVGIPSDWQYPAYPNLHYNTYVAEFNAAPVGSNVVFPINPQNWSFTLHKHAP
ncbi:MAG TPA: hypothetical protein VFU63_05890, partial [Ktedonobacterales bacterium]|nr:hypothetical protein [Ktedonobacterales bacterium]